MNKLILCVFVLLCACNKAPTEANQESSKAAGSAGNNSSSASSAPSQKTVLVEKKSYDGPLGLKKNITTKELTDVFKFESSKDLPGIYFGTPPKEIDGASEYIVFATEKQGICKIIANIPVSVVNDTGYQLKDAADKIKDLMEIKYGSKTSKNAFFSQDVYERNPQFFMMALREESAFYSYTWDAKKIKGGLPNDLESIVVRIRANKSSSGDVQVMYEFNNLDDCIKESKEKKASNL